MAYKGPLKLQDNKLIFFTEQSQSEDHKSKLKLQILEKGNVER